MVVFFKAAFMLLGDVLFSTPDYVADEYVVVKIITCRVTEGNRITIGRVIKFYQSFSSLNWDLTLQAVYGNITVNYIE